VCITLCSVLYVYVVAGGDGRSAAAGAGHRARVRSRFPLAAIHMCIDKQIDRQIDG